MNIPVIDLHCDLTYYFIEKPNANPLDPEIGCALPHLKAGEQAVLMKEAIVNYFLDTEYID